jgi:hypothetical protein
MEPGGYFWPGLFHVEQIVFPIGEIRNRLVARLNLGLGEINASSQAAGAGSGLEPAQFKPKLLQGTGQPHRRRFACPAAGLLVGPNVHQPAQKCPRS